MYAYSLKVKLYFPGPGSLPGYARRRGGDYDDGASDISSTSGFGSAYGYRSGSSKYSTGCLNVTCQNLYISKLLWWNILIFMLTFAQRTKEIENLYFI